MIPTRLGKPKPAENREPKTTKISEFGRTAETQYFTARVRRAMAVCYSWALAVTLLMRFVCRVDWESAIVAGLVFCLGFTVCICSAK